MDFPIRAETSRLHVEIRSAQEIIGAHFERIRKPAQIMERGRAPSGFELRDGRLLQPRPAGQIHLVHAAKLSRRG